MKKIPYLLIIVSLLMSFQILKPMEQEVPTGAEYLKALIAAKKDQTIEQYLSCEGPLAEKEINTFPPYKSVFFKPGQICYRVGSEKEGNLTEEERVQKAKDYLKQTGKALQKASKLSHIFLIHNYGNVALTEEKFAQFSSFFDQQNLLNSISIGFKYKNCLKRGSVRESSSQYVAGIHIHQLQDFFTKLMPWPNQHPYIFATTTAIAGGIMGGLGVYLAMRK